jgi:hypothetical protein
MSFGRSMKFFSTLLLVLAAVFTLQAGTILLEGKYQKKNIYVINSVAEAGVGFCVYEVTVNGEVTTDETNSHAFEVDLTIYGFKLGDPVIIAINYKDGCEPRILNPGALEPQPTFETQNIELNTGGVLTWETTNEQGALPFIIQQFKWNKWVNVGEIKGKGTSTRNSYSFQTIPVSGQNKFRIVQRSYDGKLRKSPTVEMVSAKRKVTMTFDKKTKAIVFSEDTNYELYNAYGQIIKRGNGGKVLMESQPKGDYYISFDNSTEKLTR